MFVQVGCGVSNWWFPVPFTLINDLYTQRLCFFYWWFGGVRQSIVMFFFFFFFKKKKNYMELHFALYISSYAIIVSKEEKMRNFAKISVKFCVSVGPNGKLWMESRFPQIFVYFFSQFSQFWNTGAPNKSHCTPTRHPNIVHFKKNLRHIGEQLGLNSCPHGTPNTLSCTSTWHLNMVHFKKN